MTIQHQECTASENHRLHAKDGTRNMLVNFSIKRLDILARMKSYQQEERRSGEEEEISPTPQASRSRTMRRWRFSLPPGLFEEEVVGNANLKYLECLDEEGGYESSSGGENHHQLQRQNMVDTTKVRTVTTTSTVVVLAPPVNNAEKNVRTIFDSNVKKKDMDIHEVDIDIFSDEFEKNSLSSFPPDNAPAESALDVVTKEEEDEVKDDNDVADDYQDIRSSRMRISCCCLKRRCGRGGEKNKNGFFLFSSSSCCWRLVGVPAARHTAL